MRAFIYRDFYDVPRIIYVQCDGRSLLLDSRFDPERYDYDDHYQVYVMPEGEEPPAYGSWLHLPPPTAVYLGAVPVNEVRFDEMKRREIDTAFFDSLFLPNSSACTLP